MSRERVLSMKLLIVEDNDGMRRTIKSVVEDIAEECLECADGDEAVALYAQHLPDWVLMDVKMERMGGLEATRQIKAGFPGANIVIVTDYDDPGMRLAALRAGARGYVTKKKLFDLRQILNPDAT
jgi:CheY-like chemotaxis protein